MRQYMGACSAGIASAVVLLVGAAVFARPSAAVTVQHSADIHATHHVASSSECGRGVPCPGEPHQPQPHHQHSADARHAHYGGEHHHASLKVPHPPHHPAAAVTASAAAAAAAAEAAHHHIKGAGSMTGGSVTAGHHPHSIPQAMQKPAVQAAEAATGPDGKPVSCHSWGSELNVETEEDKLDRPYGIDPTTGRAPDEEDAAEDAIVAAAKKAGMEPLEYEAEHDEATHTAHAHHISAAGLAPDVAESLNQGFRLTYMLSIWFKRHSDHDGNVRLLTEFSSDGNHGALDSFSAALKDAMFDILPDGVADIRTVNWIPSNPLEVDLVIYPDLLIPDEINPSWVLHATNHVMHTLVAGNLSSEFLATWQVDEIQVTPHPENNREIEDCEEVFPLHHDEQHHSYSSGIGRSVLVAVFVVCPLLVGIAVVVQMLFKAYRVQQQSVLPKYPGFERSRLKSSCVSSGGSDHPNVAAVYATHLDYYAGPYRNVYSSGGGSSSSSCSHRGSIPGSSVGGGAPGSTCQDDSRYVTPQHTEGGAA